MDYRTRTCWQMSLERLDNKKGYTDANTVLIALEFNTPLQWTREKVIFAWKLPFTPHQHLIDQFNQLKNSIFSAKEKKINLFDSTSSELGIEKLLNITPSVEVNPLLLKSNLLQNNLVSDSILSPNFPIPNFKTLKLPLRDADLSPIFPSLGKLVECRKMTIV